MSSDFGYIDPGPGQRRHDEAARWWEARRGRIVELLGEGKNQTEIGREIGKPQSAVSRWMRKMGIKQQRRKGLSNGR